MKPSVHWLLASLPLTIAVEYTGSAPAPMFFHTATLTIWSCSLR